MSRLPAVLAYHKVGSPEVGGTWCTRRQFRSHLDALARAGWQACELAAFEARLHASPDLPVPAARAVLLTFDEGYADFAAVAWPELAARRLPATLFVVTDFAGRRSGWDLPLPGHRALHLDWPALRELSRAGVAIGSHSASHRDLRRLDDAALVRELGGSRSALEDALGVPVRALAYPFGRSDARVREAARAAGYALGFSMCPRPAGEHPFALPRSGVYIIDTAGAVLDKVDPSRRGHRFRRFTDCTINACAGIAARYSVRRGSRS